MYFISQRTDKHPRDSTARQTRQNHKGFQGPVILAAVLLLLCCWCCCPRTLPRYSSRTTPTRPRARPRACARNTMSVPGANDRSHVCGLCCLVRKSFRLSRSLSLLFVVPAGVTDTEGGQNRTNQGRSPFDCLDIQARFLHVFQPLLLNWTGYREGRRDTTRKLYALEPPSFIYRNGTI